MALLLASRRVAVLVLQQRSSFGQSFKMLQNRRPIVAPRSSPACSSSFMIVQPLRARFLSSVPDVRRNKNREQGEEEREEFKESDYLPPRWQTVRFLILLGLGTLAAIEAFLFLSESIDPKANEDATFTELVPGIWTTRYHFSLPFPSFSALSSNMFALRLRDSPSNSTNVLIYNPVQLTDTIKSHIAKLKLEPKVLVIGNCEHLRFFQEWLQVFPQIKCYCPPGAKSEIVKRLQGANIDTSKLFIEELTDKSLAFSEWSKSDIYAHIFQGVPKYNEVLLFYQPAKMLLATDFAMHITDDVVQLRFKHKPFVSRYAKRSGTYEELGVSSGIGLFVEDKAKAGQSVEFVTTAWDWRSIAMAHGNPLLSSAPSTLKMQWKGAWKKLLKE